MMQGKYFVMNSWNARLKVYGKPEFGYVPTNHFIDNFVKEITPGRGLSKLEVKNLPKGITVVNKK